MEKSVQPIFVTTAPQIVPKPSGKPPPIFHDEWSKIYHGHIELTCFYCPVPAKKTIRIKDIKAVYYRKQSRNEDVLKTKDWGMTLNKVWWACDIKRSLRKSKSDYYNVILDVGETTMKGFTCQNINGLLSALAPQLKEGTPISDHFPF